MRLITILAPPLTTLVMVIYQSTHRVTVVPKVVLQVVPQLRLLGHHVGEVDEESGVHVSAKMNIKIIIIKNYYTKMLRTVSGAI